MPTEIKHILGSILLSRDSRSPRKEKVFQIKNLRLIILFKDIQPEKKKIQRAKYLSDRMATWRVRTWKKKLAPWRNRTTPVHPSTNNSTIIDLLLLFATVSTKQGLIIYIHTQREWRIYRVLKPKREQTVFIYYYCT